MTYLLKSLIRPDRVRTVPKSFSWIDRRLISDGYLERLSSGAMLLYFFLITVGDAQGLSFYGNRSISKLLKMEEDTMDRMRGELIDCQLISYRPPLYQVLELKPLRPLIVNAKKGSQAPTPIAQMLAHHKR